VKFPVPVRPLGRCDFSAEEKLRPRPDRLRLKVSPLGVPLPSLLHTLAKRFLPSNGERRFQPLQTALSRRVLHKHNAVMAGTKSTIINVFSKRYDADENFRRSLHRSPERAVRPGVAGLQHL
jgi:hypothetical protein